MHAEHHRAAPSAAAATDLHAYEDFTDPTAADITVMIASHCAAVHAAWRSRLACGADIEFKGDPVIDAARLATCVEHYLPQVLLLDKTLLDRLDPQSLLRVRLQHQRVHVMLVGEEVCPELVADVLRNRFQGFLLATCSSDICLKAVRAVSRGELWLPRASMSRALSELWQHAGSVDEGVFSPALDDDIAQALTPRERQVVALLRRGCINKEIARELGIMEDTVKKHLQSVFAKLGVHRRALVTLRGLPGYGAV